MSVDFKRIINIETHTIIHHMNYIFCFHYLINPDRLPIKYVISYVTILWREKFNFVIIWLCSGNRHTPFVVVVVYPLLLACWGESVSVALWGFAASHLAGPLRRKDPSQIQGRLRGAYLWATEEMLCSMFVNVTKGAEE